MRTIVTILTLLCAPSLLGGARYATTNATAGLETVNWTSGVSYHYDGSGNIRQIGADGFTYDKVNRLTNAEINGITRTYEYDAFGNRTNCIHEPGKPEQSDCQFGMGIDAATNRLRDVAYDDAGNVQSLDGHVFSYDALNMITRDTGSGPTREFVYTADDERIAVSSGGTLSWALRDVTGKVLREFTSNTNGGSWKWTRDHVFRNDLLLASRHASTNAAVTHHYHVDHLGTPRRVTDDNDVTVGFHDYLAFGPETTDRRDEPSPTRLKYTGHERDSNGMAGVGTLDYMHARYYSPAMGRFLSLDPVITKTAMRRPQMRNRYAYVANNPINLLDPTGKLMQLHGTDCADKKVRCTTRLQAFEALKGYVGKDAAKFLQMDKKGFVTLKGISAFAFAKLGFAASQVGAMIRHTGSTAHFALSADAGTLAKGGARSTPVAGGMYVRVAPSSLPSLRGGAFQTMDTTMAHEFGHAVQGMYDIPMDSPAYGRIKPIYNSLLYGVPASEGFAVWSENQYRAEHGLEPRTYYWYGPDAAYGEDYIPPP